ncbi:glycosyl transferase family 2 [Kineococcus xinjiangensis]|uniref:Glycosyl transferase family 2 n=1 Tax=Kineococcus xinjiangensis TaxID=512762 RepID=A0A2S6ILV4_9ACTN|nr:glycosyltransferase family 2 protein [Kineococcus xinjiangensis]PPK95214.1 glycosyl transferase family 2 [Kineococcus xinjiangensis]
MTGTELPTAQARPRDASRAGRLIGVPAAFEPARIVEVDVSQPLPAVAAAEAGEPQPVCVVVRLCGQPVGMVLLPGPCAPAALAEAVDGELRPALADLAPAHGLAPTALTASGLPHPSCPVRDHREAVRGSGPRITVVVCTRERPESLQRCLDSIAALDYHDLEILVVDNAPRTEATRELCAAAARSVPLRYVREPAAGLSRARNTAIREASGEVIAFLDDDERADPDWLVALAAEFQDPRVGVVSGLVLPAELQTQAQAMFETFGGHSKGRGFARDVFDEDYQRRVQSPLYPRPAFGVGANMAFRVGALHAIDGFDPHLGAGSPTKGAEDTAAITEVMLAGWTAVYAPDAVTWHYHRRDDNALHEQLDGYQRGLGAFYVSLLRRRPSRALAMLKLPLLAFADTRSASAAGASTGADAPAGAADAAAAGAPDAARSPTSPASLLQIARGAGIYLRAAAREPRGPRLVSAAGSRSAPSRRRR